MSVAVNGFASCGILLCKRDIFSEDEFAPSFAFNSNLFAAKVSPESESIQLSASSGDRTHRPPAAEQPFLQLSGAESFSLHPPVTEPLSLQQPAAEPHNLHQTETQSFSPHPPATELLSLYPPAAEPPSLHQPAAESSSLHPPAAKPPSLHQPAAESSSLHPPAPKPPSLHPPAAESSSLHLLSAET
ncbi:serum response factor-binding protein 1 [Plakobranchus ocellatus]|uniref:Serum response factor-binding protein 1 n=1 Tax=Plakobranchus ocellatus TaxID=259542 RepID=A0AAV3YS43_9GAST|nr:serum response factor-binding protein 1 [Plakobranchus ocellatus]